MDFAKTLDDNMNNDSVCVLSGNANIVDANNGRVDLNMSVLDLNVSLDDEGDEGVVEVRNDRSNGIDLNVNASGEEEEDEMVDRRVNDIGFDLNVGVEIKCVDGDEEREMGGNGLDGEGRGLCGVLDGDVVDKGGLTSDLLADSCRGGVAEVNCEGNVGSRSGGRGRKGRKVLESATRTVLRRSARTGRCARLVQENVGGVIGLNEVKDELVSPAVSVVSTVVSAVSEEKIVVLGGEEFEGRHFVSPKPELPPSSVNLEIDGNSVFDIFSVYSFLRSFSTVLFLSPFVLDDFVAALRCKVPTLLFDNIHLSLLQTLRKHLEFLSAEDSESTSACLRSLDWNHLDLVTWPIFMVEYLLMHSSISSPGFDKSRLKSFESDYYKQSASVKIEMLRFLCDDVNEVETIRSELNRRTLTTGPRMDFDRKMTPKKRRAVTDVSGASCITEEVFDETTDWNSDECCLCKMDGNLICCDGCPAAFHSRCVGVVSTLLPEGDWYCPECTIDRRDLCTRERSSIRGVELLGIDPYDRQYYSSCGYLLVSDPGDMESPFRYYHRNDLAVVIEAIKTPHIFYGKLVSAIMKFWNVSAKVKCDNGEQIGNSASDYLWIHQTPENPLLPLSAPSETYVRKPEVKSITYPYSGTVGIEVAEPVAMEISMSTGKPLVSLEGSAEGSQAITKLHNVRNTGTSKRYSRKVKNSITEKPVSCVDCTLASTSQEVEVGKNIQLADCVHIPSSVDISVITPVQHGSDYMNLYSFAQTASSVAEVLLRKSSDKISEDSKKSVEEIISSQLKVLSNMTTDFCWSNIQNLDFDIRKEKCGWCFSCQVSEDGEDCLFILKDTSSFLKNFTSGSLGICPSLKWKAHLIDVMCHILCIEDRLHGLLLGPWLNLQYSNIWRNAVCKASDVASLKHFLVMLESNLHIRAFSAEWHRQVDSAITVGSASHIVTSSMSSLRVSSKNGINRRRASSHPDLESSQSSACSGLGLFWWRGGRISRELFKWKVLPVSLSLKAARQAGTKKIPGIVYSDNSDYAKRSKYVAWRASVDASSSVAQLALQVREFDANIKWDVIENTKLLSKMDKEFGKSFRSFKKVIVRRKCSEGTVVKYLLDFGKRRFIPDVVMKHGSIVEEALSNRRKFWLEESYVPLHLVKAFEERRIARKINKTSSSKLQVNGIVLKKFSRESGFSYLFSKAERSEYYQCGHCRKDVLIRDAVSCQYCEGFFHKRHVRKSAGAITAECTYACSKCLNACTKIDDKKGKHKSLQGKKVSKIKRPAHPKVAHVGKDKKLDKCRSKNKNYIVVPLRRSARKVKLVSQQSKKIGGKKKGRQTTCRKRKSKIPKTPKKPKKQKKDTFKKKRSMVCHSYWLNGLWLSRKPNHERHVQFGNEKLLLASKQLKSVVDKPKCSLCLESESTSALNYIGCEMCGDWFHGDAFGLDAEKVEYLIGFKCHTCRDRAPPECPYMLVIRTDEGQIGSSFSAKVGSDAGKFNAPGLLDEHAAIDSGLHQTIIHDTECDHINISLEKTMEEIHDCKERSWRSSDGLEFEINFGDISPKIGGQCVKMLSVTAMDSQLVNFELDVAGKKSAPSACSNGSMEATTLLGSAVSQNPVGSSFFPAEATSDSVSWVLLMLTIRFHFKKFYVDRNPSDYDCPLFINTTCLELQVVTGGDLMFKLLGSDPNLEVLVCSKSWLPLEPPDRGVPKCLDRVELRVPHTVFLNCMLGRVLTTLFDIWFNFAHNVFQTPSR